MEYDGPDSCLFKELERFYPIKRQRVSTTQEISNTSSPGKIGGISGEKPKEELVVKVPVEKSVSPLPIIKGTSLNGATKQPMSEWYEKTIDRETIIEGLQHR
jgi:hypothetical protein